MNQREMKNIFDNRNGFAQAEDAGKEYFGEPIRRDHQDDRN